MIDGRENSFHNFAGHGTIVSIWRNSTFEEPLRPTGLSFVGQTFSQEGVDCPCPFKVVSDDPRPAEHTARPGQTIWSVTAKKPKTRRHGTKPGSGQRTRGHRAYLVKSNCWPSPIVPLSKFLWSAVVWGPRYPRSRSCHVWPIGLYGPWPKFKTLLWPNGIIFLCQILSWDSVDLTRFSYVVSGDLRPADHTARPWKRIRLIGYHWLCRPIMPLWIFLSSLRLFKWRKLGGRAR